jgi:hypothetical protein
LLPSHSIHFGCTSMHMLTSRQYTQSATLVACTAQHTPWRHQHANRGVVPHNRGDNMGMQWKAPAQLTCT